MRAWKFSLKLPKKKLNTFVYSDTGTDISERFVPHVVSNIKEIDDPLAEKKGRKNES
jgi:hypothetical protein